MKLLLPEYASFDLPGYQSDNKYISINYLQCGLSAENEKELIQESLSFIDNICNVSTEIFSKFKAPPHVCGIAYHIFHLFQKKVPFSEFNHLMLASLSVFVACKIHNIHVLYENFQKFYYENKGKLKSLSKPS